MTTFRLTFGILAVAGCLSGLTGCGQDSHAGAIPVKFSTLDDQDRPLRDDFNRDVGKVRLMFLVDPICPGCLRGLADMDRDLLSKLPANSKLAVYVVYEPVIGGTAKDIPGAAGLLHTPFARHYWNPTGAFGNQMSSAFGLRNGDKPVYAWDVWMIYPPNAIWKDAAPPQPQLLMHQLAGLEGQPRFPHLDSRKFADTVQKMLARSR